MPMVMLCPACDLAHRRTAAPAFGRVRCVRCREPLQHALNGSMDVAIALGVCGLVLLWLSNFFPLVAMHVNGSSRETTLVGAALGLYDQHDRMLALLVFLTIVIAPLLQVVTLLYVLVPLWRGESAYGQNFVIRLITRVRPWSFTEVFMLGTVVALVRLAKFAHVVPGVALWSCALLMLCLSALTNRASPEQLWRWATARGPR
jgi:paraquat-inducible protein A